MLVDGPGAVAGLKGEANALPDRALLKAHSNSIKLSATDCLKRIYGYFAARLARVSLRGRLVLN